MPLNRSYTAELEFIIKDVLLPVFDKYYREKGIVPEYTRMNPEVLKQLHAVKKVPALFLPKHDRKSSS